jgi:F-type H+-transporting ATPase subunit gamma
MLRSIASKKGLTPALLKSSAPISAVQQRRCMATEESMKRRLSTIVVVEKLTRAMKMVAVVRMQRYEKSFHIAKKFSDPIMGFFGEEQEQKEGDDVTLVTISTDRGLCGSVNSQVKRAIDGHTKYMNANKIPFSLIIMGTKNRMNLQKQHENKVKYCFQGLMGQTFAFETALQLTEHVAREKPSFINLIGNKFTSLFNLNPHTIHMRGYKTIQPTEQEDFERFLGKTKTLGAADVYENFCDFRLACALHTQLKESDLCEQASRMMAMESASSNAEDMRKELSLLINRRRQAKVTTDLLEIIAGVVGVEAIQKEDEERAAMAKKK